MNRFFKSCEEAAKSTTTITCGGVLGGIGLILGLASDDETQANIAFSFAIAGLSMVLVQCCAIKSAQRRYRLSHETSTSVDSSVDEEAEPAETVPGSERSRLLDL